MTGANEEQWLGLMVIILCWALAAWETIKWWRAKP